jgi:hypothetical protein
MILKSQLDQLLREKVLDIRFTRRLGKENSSSTRRMLCTKSLEILNSNNGRLILNYKPPTQQPKYDPSKENLVTVWDIFMQDYRNIPVESCNVIEALDPEPFWEKFNNQYRMMSQTDKTNYMSS